jgi:TRAP-type C4-dicarboxylate transport system substrate-binding protein
VKDLKSLRSVVILVAAVALIAAVACAPTATPTPEETETIELTYSNFFPATHLNSILADKFCQEINQRSNGRVEITYYPGGTLTPAAQIYDGVVQGLSDIGMSVLSYTMGRFPASELVDMPHGYPNGWVATKVANDFYEEFKPEEFDDVHVLYFHAHGPGVLLTTEKPVRKIEDLQGLVIRSTGVGAKIVEALGGEGYAAAQGDAYELMSKGTIDGSLTPREVLKGWNQAEVVKYVTGCYDIGYTADMFVVINKDKWNSLPEDIQDIFTEVSQEWIEKHGMVWTYYDKVAIDYFLTFPGRELIELSPEEMARWVAATEPLIDEYIREKTAPGFPAADYEAYLLERTEYWAERTPTEESCVDWVEKELVE